jgi:hypothetical protein
VFQKSYTGNILKIGRNKFQKSYFSRKLPKTEREPEGGQRPPSHIGGAAQALAVPPWCEKPLAVPLMMPLRLYKASGWKTLGESAIFQKEFRSSTATVDEFWGTEVSVPAPCRDGEVPSKPSPSFSIAVSAVSIDLTAISINLAVSYDEEGVVHPRG